MIKHHGMARLDGAIPRPMTGTGEAVAAVGAMNGVNDNPGMIGGHGTMAMRIDVMGIVTQDVSGMRMHLAPEALDRVGPGRQAMPHATARVPIAEKEGARIRIGGPDGHPAAGTPVRGVRNVNRDVDVRPCPTDMGSSEITVCRRKGTHAIGSQRCDFRA